MSGVSWESVATGLGAFVIAVLGFLAARMSASDTRQWRKLDDHEQRLARVEAHFEDIIRALKRIESKVDK